MKFLGVSGVFDYAGLDRNSRYRSGSCCLPRITRTSASGLHLFGALLPTPPIPLFTLRRVPRGTQRKTRGRADRYSLLVRIFHSLLHAGLARRTVNAIFQQLSEFHCSKLTIFFFRIAALSTVMKAKKPPKQIHAIHCPTCGAGPGEKCELSTG